MSSISNTGNNSTPLLHHSPITTHVPEQRTNVEPSFSHVVMPEAKPLSNRFVEQLSKQSSSIALATPAFSDSCKIQEEENTFTSAVPVFFEDDLESPSGTPTTVETRLSEVLPSTQPCIVIEEQQEPAESKISFSSCKKRKAACVELEKQEVLYTSIEWSHDVVIKAQTSLEPRSLGNWVTVASLPNNLKLRIQALGCSLRSQIISWDGWKLQILDEVEVRESITRQGGGQCQPRNLMNFLQDKHKNLMKYGTFSNGGFSLAKTDQDIDWKTKYEALKKQEIERKSIEWSKDVVIKAQTSLEPSSLGNWVTVANLTNDLKLRIKALGCSQSGQSIVWNGWQIQITGPLEVMESITRQGSGQCQPRNLMNFFKKNYENLTNKGTFNFS